MEPVPEQETLFAMPEASPSAPPAPAAPEPQEPQEPQEPADDAAVRLASLTTFRVGGPAPRLVTARTVADVIDAVSAADAAGEPVLLAVVGRHVHLSLIHI